MTLTPKKWLYLKEKTDESSQAPSLTVQKLWPMLKFLADRQTDRAKAICP